MGISRSGRAPKRLQARGRDSVLQRPIRVLVAEEERAIATSMVKILNFHGFEAMAVFSGMEAIAQASTFRPHVALLDVALGDITGIEAASAIVHLLPICRIGLITSVLPTREFFDKAASDGLLFELFLKPVHLHKLVDSLKQMAPLNARVHWRD